jgi:flagellar basal-body rod protein FlgF
MNPGMYKVLSGAIAQMRRLEVVSENLANVNTVGHKGGHVAFSEVLAQVSQQKDRPGGMVAIGEQRTDFSQGILQQTENPLDVAIDGEGFFAIATERGTRYTRQGNFSRAADGTIVTTLGEPVLGETGPLRVSGKDLQITPEGTVVTADGEIGRLQIVRFADPKTLMKEGHGLFRAPEGSAQPAVSASTTTPEGFSLLQGYVEEANVTPIETLVSLITTQRQFEVYARAMKTMDAATEKVLNEATR